MRRTSLALLTALCLAGCSEQPTAVQMVDASADSRGPCFWPPRGATTLVVTPTSVTLAPGETVALTVADETGRPVPACVLTFATNAPAVASVDAAGVVTALDEPGTALITLAATRGRPSLTARVTITVEARIDGVQPSTLVAGRSHTCGLSTSGAAYCWGWNRQGELGDGDMTWRRVTQPVAVAGGLTFVSLSAGEYHTCGLTSAGTAWCWGRNSVGQLGDGTVTNRAAPQAVAGGLTFQRIDAGTGRTCALTSDGAAYCWGGGLLGTGDGAASRVPRAVQTTARYVAITVGAGVSCGLQADGVAQCWGANHSGQLGDGSGVDALSPVSVAAGEARFASVSAGDAHVCGLTREGAALCWGWNNYGQIGNDDRADALRPAPVVGDLRFNSLVAGDWYSCGVTVGGAGFCWGYAADGNLGHGDYWNERAPVAVAGEHTFRVISAGWGHSCGVTPAGEGLCWGFNGNGELGTGTLRDSGVPVPVSGGLIFARP